MHPNPLWIFTVIFATLPPQGVCDLSTKHFDFLAFAQVWPITSCDIWESEGASHTCQLPEKVDQWTIHGIWPSVTKGKEPFNCNNSVEFDLKALAPIMPQLEVQWINVHKDTSKDDFWKHEWSKHGTCAIQLEPLNTELKYFSKALEFNNQYPITAMLSKAGIVPGNAYTGDEIIDAVKKATGKNPNIECVKNKSYRLYSDEAKNLLAQVMICMDKNFTLIDCKVQNGDGACSPNKKINFYPTSPHSLGDYKTSAGTVVGIIAVVIVMIVAFACLYICYKKNVTRYRGYENI